MRLVRAEKVALKAFGAMLRLASPSINLTGAEGMVLDKVTTLVT